MAKARQALSMWKGRAGGVVYSVLNGNQIMRSAPASVSNPKSDAQVAQRMKLAPAQNFYKQLEALVSLGFASHTFQGKKYGNANRLRFLQLAMMNNQGPYVPKDTMDFIPFDYQVSEGSLPSFTGRMYLYEDTARLNEIASGITETEITAENVEQWANAFGCNPGDQISILTVALINGYYIPKVTRFLVQAGTSFANLYDDYDISFWLPTGKTLATAAFGSLLIKYEGEAVCAVLSRQQANGEFLRSSEYMHIATAIREKYYTPAALDAALRSYQNVQSANSTDPYYNNLGSQAWPGTIYASVMSYKVGNTTGKATILWGKTDGGNKIVFTEDGGAQDAVICISEAGVAKPLEVWDPTEGLVGVTIGQLTTSVQWAGIEEWKDEYFEQWNSGQKAVRPIVAAPTPEPVNSVMRTWLAGEFGTGEVVQFKQSELIYESTNYENVLVLINDNKPYVVIKASWGIKVKTQDGFLYPNGQTDAVTFNADEHSISIDGVTYAAGAWNTSEFEPDTLLAFPVTTDVITI